MRSCNSIVNLLVAVIILSSCASSYKPIGPQGLDYRNVSQQDGIDFSFKYEVLSLRGNKKYAKKEEKRDVDVVAVKITNNTNNALHFNRDMKIVSNGRELIPMEREVVGKKIKQGVAIYLLYALLTVQTQSGGCTPTNGCNIDTKIYPIGIPIAIGNMAVAGSANGSFKNELLAYDLNNKVIEPGQTVHGILGFRNLEFGGMEIELTNPQKSIVSNK